LGRWRPGFGVWWRVLQAGAVAADRTLDRLGQVVPQMPPVGDLDRQRRTLSCALGVAPAAVPADDLHARVGIQPSAEGLRGPLRQHVDRPAGLDVDQDGAVDVPLRSAKSSTPSTSGVWSSGSAARMSRISVERLTAQASLPVSREPARPPRASATACSTACSWQVRRPWRVVRPGTCSANVALLHLPLPQKNRRTCRSISTS
jgi:hypothetical protein